MALARGVSATNDLCSNGMGPVLKPGLCPVYGSQSFDEDRCDEIDSPMRSLFGGGAGKAD